MRGSVQNRPDLYGQGAPRSPRVEPGVYAAKVFGWRSYRNDFGERLVVSFALPSGALLDLSLASGSGKGRLGAVLRGVLGREPSQMELLCPERALPARTECIVVAVDATDRNGRLYSRVESVSR